MAAQVLRGHERRRDERTATRRIQGHMPSQQHAAVCRSRAHLFQQTGLVALVNQGPHARARLITWPHFDLRQSLDQMRRKVSGHRFVHQHPADGGAHLPGHDASTAHNAAHSGAQVSIRSHDGRRLAAQLQRQAGQVLGGGQGDLLAHMGRAGEADDIDLGVRTQVLCGHDVLLNEGVDDACRNALVGHQTGHDLGVHQGGLVGCLDDHGTACGQRRGQRTHQQGHRRIPGHDDGGHADRFALNVRVNIGLHFDDAAKQVARQPSVIAQLGNAGHDLAFGLSLQLAIELHQRLHHLRLVVLQAIGKQAQNVSAKLGLLRPSGRFKGAAGAGDGGVHLLHAGSHKLSCFFARGWIHGIPDGVNAAGLDPLAVKVIVRGVHDRGALMVLAGIEQNNANPRL